MLVALTAKDKDGALQVRMDNRPAHVEYLKSSECVRQAGPLMIDGEMRGSLIILEVDSMADAEAWAANDPYKNAGLFQSVEMIEWNRVIG